MRREAEGSAPELVGPAVRPQFNAGASVTAGSRSVSARYDYCCKRFQLSAGLEHQPSTKVKRRLAVARIELLRVRR